MKLITIFSILFIFTSNITPIIHTISPSNSILNRLILFRTYTKSSGHNEPNISRLKKSNRKFIAKFTNVDSFGSSQYYSFETDADIKKLIRALKKSEGAIGDELNLYYY